MGLRDYQKAAVCKLKQAWQGGVRSLCLVAPPGAGKTEMAMECVDPLEKTLWVVHRRELAEQAKQRLQRRFGENSVGVLMGGYPVRKDAMVTVATVQTLLAQTSPLTGFKFAYLDECHHYAADQWSTVRFSQRGGFRRELGATATPERDRGVGLGDIFQKMIVAAHYSELIAAGYIVKPYVARPKRNLGSNWACNPLDAWCLYGCWPAILWVPSVDLARHYAEESNVRKLMAACITETTSSDKRAKAIEDYSSGAVQLLTNVSTLMEGMDFPQCRAAILGRSFRSVGSFLQATGRVLRPHPDGKPSIVIDLTGCIERHGMPYQDRDYSLKGNEPISGGDRETCSERGVPEEPSVVGVALFDDIPTLDRPLSVKLPVPDPKWWKLKQREEERYWKNVKRYGVDIAAKVV